MNKRTNFRGKLLASCFVLGLCFAPYGVNSVMAEPQESLQSDVISGTVVDDTGETIIGATVLIVGGDASQGTITDFDGNFTIKCKAGTKLQISYVGYETQIVTAQKGMRVTLKTDAVALQGVEVVDVASEGGAVGFGRGRRRAG